MKYNPFYFCKLQSFPNYYCNPNLLKMSSQMNGFNWKWIKTKHTSHEKIIGQKNITCIFQWMWEIICDTKTKASWYLFLTSETLTVDKSAIQIITSLQQQLFFHGRTILDLLTDYWTFSKSMVKLDLTGRQEMLYICYGLFTLPNLHSGWVQEKLSVASWY